MDFALICFSFFFIVNWAQIFLQTWFRNANQCYPITRWLGGFNPKASGAWEWSHRWGAWDQFTGDITTNVEYKITRKQFSFHSKSYVFIHFRFVPGFYTVVGTDWQTVIASVLTSDRSSKSFWFWLYNVHYIGFWIDMELVRMFNNFSNFWPISKN